MAQIDQAFQYVDEYLEYRMKADNVPGLALAVTDRDKTIWRTTHGFADIAVKTPVVADSRFEIGSIGKSLTALALLQLRDERKLDLEAPVSEYLPWFQVQSEFQPITVDHLMNHTGAIIRGTEQAPHGLYDAWALRQTKAAAEPGLFWHYSSLGYKILGFLIERLTGRSYQEVVQTRVLDPLGMIHTYPAITFESRKKTVTGYCNFYDDRPEHNGHGLVPSSWAEFATADGSLVSNVDDVAAYLRMLLSQGRGPDGPLISDEGFGLLTTPERTTGNEHYSYGLAVYAVEDHIYLGHGGGTAGFMSAFIADTDEGLGVVCLVNKMGETDVVVASATHVLTTLRAATHGRDLPPMPKAVDPTFINNAADYVGTYRSGGRFVRLTANDGKLQFEHEGREIVLERRPQDAFTDRFYVGHPGVDLFLLEFGREGGRVVEAFHGPDWFVGDGYTGPLRFDYPDEWEAYTGHYRARNPEMSNFRVIVRKGALLLVRPSSQTDVLRPLGGALFGVGAEELSPETLRFEAVVDGQALRADYSGCPYYRTFTP